MSVDSNLSKILLIDDDPDFAALFTYTAETLGLNVVWRESLEDLGRVCRLGEFDVLLFDYRLNNMTGRELAEYVDALFANKPVIIISSDPKVLQEGNQWPKCIRCRLDKRKGILEILRAMQEVTAMQPLARLSDAESYRT